MVKQLTFHDIPYVRCLVCGAIGQRKRAKIICSCCQQKVFDKDEKFHCKICGGEMYEISSNEHDWELHWGIARQEDPDLDKISCVKKPHLAEGVQKFTTGRYDVPFTPPPDILKQMRKSKNVYRPHIPTKYCECGAVIEQNQKICETCTWIARLAKRGVEATTLNEPLMKDLLK